MLDRSETFKPFKRYLALKSTSPAAPAPCRLLHGPILNNNSGRGLKCCAYEDVFQTSWVDLLMQFDSLEEVQDLSSYWGRLTSSLTTTRADRSCQCNYVVVLDTL